MADGDYPLHLKFCSKLTPFVKNSDFQLIFTGSAAAVKLAKVQ